MVVAARGLVAALAAGVALAVAPPAPSAPPSTQPPADDGNDPANERRLAEFSFAIFVTVDFGVDPDAFGCAEPSTAGAGEEIICFALVDSVRVIVASTVSSGGTGRFEWVVLADQTLSGGAAITSTTIAAGTPATDVAEINLSDAAILSYGADLNRTAQRDADAYVARSNGAIATVDELSWDAATATVTLAVASSASPGLDRDTLAWILVQNEKLRWAPGQPFRLAGATLRPRLVLTVDTNRYVSEYDLMLQLADQVISQGDWLAAAGQ